MSMSSAEKLRGFQRIEFGELLPQDQKIVSVRTLMMGMNDGDGIPDAIHSALFCTQCYRHRLEPVFVALEGSAPYNNVYELVSFAFKIAKSALRTKLAH